MCVRVGGTLSHHASQRQAASLASLTVTSVTWPLTMAVTFSRVMPIAAPILRSLWPIATSDRSRSRVPQAFITSPVHRNGRGCSGSCQISGSPSPASSRRMTTGTKGTSRTLLISPP